MLSIDKTTSGEYIKLTSPEITTFLTSISPFTDLTIEMGLNCAPEVKRAYKPQLPVLSCTSPANEYTGRGAWRLDLSYYRLNNISMTKFIVKNIDTGALSEEVVTVDWAAYNIACPTGCLLEASGTFYNTNIAGAFTNAAIAGGFTGAYSAKSCGDYIQLFTAEPNNIPYAIEFANGDKKLLQYSYIGIILDVDAIYIDGTFMGGTSLVDGVYRVKYYTKQENGARTEDSSCFFLDNATACNMVSKIGSLLQETEEQYKESGEWLALAAAHWGLTKAKECHGCNCEDLCALYKEFNILYNKTKSTVNCAC
jgi:hypothetical protein